MCSQSPVSVLCRATNVSVDFERRFRFALARRWETIPGV